MLISHEKPPVDQRRKPKPGGTYYIREEVVPPPRMTKEETRTEIDRLWAIVESQGKSVGKPTLLDWIDGVISDVTFIQYLYRKIDEKVPDPEIQALNKEQRAYRESLPDLEKQVQEAQHALNVARLPVIQTEKDITVMRATLKTLQSKKKTKANIQRITELEKQIAAKERLVKEFKTNITNKVKIAGLADSVNIALLGVLGVKSKTLRLEGEKREIRNRIYNAYRLKST